jgi:hypothetical protein
MPRLPKVPPESGDPAPDALGPPPAPSAYRQRNPYESRPVEYQAPPMLVEHRGLALVFLAAVIVFALYCFRTPLRTVALDAPAARAAAQAQGATQGPSATQVPGTTQVPGATQVAGAAQAPGATQSPDATQAPAATQSPGVVQSNAPAQAPIYVEAIPDKDR